MITFVLFMVLIFGSGLYVAPHVQPQIGNAVSALLDSKLEPS